MSTAPLLEAQDDEIAEQTGLSRTGVFDICKRHAAGGAKALKDAPGGRKVGDKRLLDAEQEATVRKLMADKTPDQLKMPYALWTRAAVGQLIEQRFGLRLAVPTMGPYLARWGFTPQKPMKKACEQSPASVKKWLQEEYPVIAACAKAEGAEIPLGRRPDFAVTTSVVAATRRPDRRPWFRFEGAINSDILIDFLKSLVRDAGRKVYLILDNLRVHHSKPVKVWLAANKHAIEVFYLPSYSPDLNPDEMANADLKQAVTKPAPARTKLQLVKATPTKHLRSVQRQPDRIRKYFEHEPARYAA